MFNFKKIHFSLIPLILLSACGNNLTSITKNNELPNFPTQGSEANIAEIRQIGLSKIPESPTIKIYEVVTNTDYESRASDLKQSLSLFDANKVIETEEAIIYKSGNHSFEIFKQSDSFVYNNSNTPEQIDNGLDKNNAIKVAKKFLSQLGVKDYTYTDFREDKEFYTDKQGIENSRSTSFNLYFNKKLNGKEIYGGDRIEIDISGDYVVTNAFILTRSFKPKQDAELISPLDAFNNALHGVGKIYSESSAAKAEITDYKLAYWTDPAPTKQNDVVPVYVLTGKTENGDLVTILTPAIRE
jgi:hypothetical protein